MSENRAIYMEDEELCTIEIDEIDCSENCGHIEILENSINERDKYIKKLLNINLEREEIYKRALDTWGELDQINMVFEEMSELQKELCKYLRGKDPEEQKRKIAEEIADVEIMLEQMKLLFNLHKLVDGQKEYKVFRLKQKLDKEDLR